MDNNKKHFRITFSFDNLFSCILSLTLVAIFLFTDNGEEWINMFFFKLSVFALFVLMVIVLSVGCLMKDKINELEDTISNLEGEIDNIKDSKNDNKCGYIK